MFHGITKFLKKPTSEAIDAVVRQVAEQSLESVCKQVEDCVDGMTLPEARGYVRARAAKIVRRQARQVISRQPAAIQELKDMVVQAATERILPAVLRQTSVGVPRTLELPMAA